MGADFDVSHLSKDRVTAWLGTSVQGHNLYGSTCYAKKSWLSGLSSQSRLRDCQSAADQTNGSSTSDDSYSQVGSTTNETTWTPTQSSQCTRDSAATDLTEYSEVEEERETCYPHGIERVTSHSSYNYAGVNGISLQDVVSDANDNWVRPVDAKIHGATPVHQPDLACNSNNTNNTNVHPTGVSDTVQQGPTGINRRRSGTQHGTQLPPCRLKRDTESTDHFVTLLIVFATRLVTAIWPLSASPPMMTSCFNGAGVLPLRVFIQETLRRSKTSYSTLQVALYYLILLKDKLPHCDFTREQPQSSSSSSSSRSSSCSEDMPQRSTCRAMQCGRRMFLSALMLASKYLQDRNYSTRAWSKISGLRSCEINDNEREYLKAVNFDLHLPKTAFDNWSKIVLALSKLSKQFPQEDSINHSSAFGLEQLLSELGSDVGSDDSGHAKFSDFWWSNLLRGLQPEIVRDDALTEEFLQRLVSPGLDDNQSCTDPTLPTPPTSPETSGDTTFSDALRAHAGDGYNTPLTMSQPSSRAQSPAPVTAVPSQPRLPNLPTPVSTPQAFRYCALPKDTSNAPLRSAASLLALRSIQKHPAINANLDRCPPPKPQAFAPSSNPCSFRPAVPSMNNVCRSNGTTCLSPVSGTSGTTEPTSRSRSSSLTSTNSTSYWQTEQAVPPVTIPQNLNKTSHYGVPAPLCVGSGWNLDQSSPMHHVQSSTHHLQPSTVVTFSDEGYGSGEDPLTRKMTSGAELDCDLGAAETLLALAFRDKKSSSSSEACHNPDTTSVISCSTKGHKRTHSRLDAEKVHCQVRQLLAADLHGAAWNQDEVVADEDELKNRCIQTPTKCWAGSKFPVLKKQGSKRLAVNCPAPDMAARFLKAQYFESVLTAI